MLRNISPSPPSPPISQLPKPKVTIIASCLPDSPVSDSPVKDSRCDDFAHSFPFLCPVRIVQPPSETSFEILQIVAVTSCLFSRPLSLDPSLLSIG